MLWHYFLPIHRKNVSYFTLFETDLRQYVWEKTGKKTYHFDEKADLTG